jgi:antitoxin YefM
MRVILATDFRKNMSTELDRVHDDWEPLMIFRTGGKPAAVLMSLDDFNSRQKAVGLPEASANKDAG